MRPSQLPARPTHECFTAKSHTCISFARKRAEMTVDVFDSESRQAYSEPSSPP
jgi:hypothetical protein